MKKKSKLILCLVAIILALGVLGGALFALNMGGGSDYMGNIRKGQDYLAALNYDKAVVAFKSALKQDASRIEAYEGLAKAYAGQGHDAMAINTLTTGIEETDSISLKLMLSRDFGDSSYLSFSTSDTAPAEELTSKTAESTGGSNGLNSSLLTFISGANFGNYNSKYGIATTSAAASGNDYVLDKVNMTIHYEDNATQSKIDRKTGRPYDNFVPDSISVGNIQLIFNSSEQLTVEMVRKFPGMTNFEYSNDQIRFEAYGCSVTVAVEPDGTIRNDASNTITVKEKNETSNQVCTLEGKITDAATGKGLAGATVTATNEDGDSVSGVTDSDGYYSLEVGDGEYDVTVEKEGYITSDDSVDMLGNSDQTERNYVLTKELGDDEIRFVLTWNSAPRDLDSYLLGEAGDGTNVRNYFGDRSHQDKSGNLICELDVDDTDGDGPETTTLYDMNGHYEFVVVDFNVTGTMASQGANVKIYKGNSLIEDIDIVSDVENQWLVCEIDAGEVTVVNEAIFRGTNSTIK